MDFFSEFEFTKLETIRCQPKKKMKTHDINFEEFRSPNILVFHTRTSSQTGSVIQLAWILSDTVGNELQSYCEYLYTDEKLDPFFSNVTSNVLEAQALDPKSQMELWSKVFEVCVQNRCTLVTHDAQFIMERINHTCKMHGIVNLLNVADVVCTMKASMSRCGLVRMDGKKKMPTSSELYETLYDKPPVKTSEKKDECNIILQSFIKGRLLGWW